MKLTSEVLLIKLLPSMISFKYTVIYPVIYIYNENKDILLAVYSYDKKKKVLFVSDYNNTKYRYMSLYEFNTNNWKILTKSEYEEIIYQLEPLGLPF